MTYLDRQVSRREFAIRGMAVAAGAVGLSAFGLAGCSPSGPSDTGGSAEASSAYVSSGGQVLADRVSLTWDQETDVLIIGGGGAGAAAALMAKEQGAEALILEKGAVAGGCTAICGQAIAVGGSSVQKEMGIEDTVEDYTDFLVAVSQGDPELLKTIGMNSLDSYNWLADMGVVTPPVEGVPGITFGGSHEVTPFVPRTHWTEGIWTVLQKKLDEEGIEILTSTPATALITDVHTGEVLGAVAGEGSSPHYIKARKAVILAAGGFTNNPDMVHEHITTGTYVSFSSKTDDGDGILLGESVGAGVSYLNSGNDASAYADPQGACIYLIESAPVAGDPAYIAVNTKGKRFVDESDFQVPVNRGIMAQPGGMCYVIACGESGVAGFGTSAGQIPTSLVTSDSIEGLAGELGIDPKSLQDTVDAWNASCADGNDAAFGRERCLKPLDAAPFAAAEVYPGFSSTLSGVSVNTEMRALAALTREPIGRLFAAGANSNAMGRVYACCGSGVGGAIATGRIAGVNAAKLEPWA